MIFDKKAFFSLLNEVQCVNIFFCCLCFIHFAQEIFTLPKVKNNFYAFFQKLYLLAWL